MTARNLADAYKDKTLEFRPDTTVSESLDEVIAQGVKWVHLERMDKNAYWMGLDLADGRHVRVNFWTPRATIKVNAEIEESTPPINVLARHHVYRRYKVECRTEPCLAVTFIETDNRGSGCCQLFHCPICGEDQIMTQELIA